MLRSELEAELKTLKHGTRKGAKRWPVKLLLNTVVEAATIANSIEGTDPNWPVPTATFVSIYRSEEAKRSSIDNYIPPTETDKPGPLIDDGD